jgi:predicted aldo/keto reductase-like oxidoreductase
MLDRQLEDGIAYAHEKGIGVVAMGPVGGGRLGEPNEQLAKGLPGVERIPELALRFVLSNANVTMALSGMSSMRQVEENLAVASDARTLSDSERAQMNAHLDRLKDMADLYCTACGYCKPCPQEVDIPAVFGLYNSARVYGLWKGARDGYARLAGDGKRKAADACVDCGECEGKCPQHIPIRKQLKEAHKALAAGGAPRKP